MTVPLTGPLIERLRSTEARYEELNQVLADPETVSDNKKYQKTTKAHSELGQIVAKFREYTGFEHGIRETEAMVREETDPQFRSMAEEELASLEQRLAQCETELKLLLLPKDPNDDSVGASRSCLPMPPALGVSRKLSRSSKGEACTAG